MVTVILVGGASRRMGKDKATLEFNGKAMCQSLIEKYLPISEAVAYCANEEGRFSFENARQIIDRFPNMGPMNGIVSAFEDFDCDEIFMTGTDIPCGDTQLVLKLAELCQGHDACIINHGIKGRQPLFAIYKRSCYEPALSLLQNGRKSLNDLLETVNTKYVSQQNLPDFDLDAILENINTAEDYKRVCRS